MEILRTAIFWLQNGGSTYTRHNTVNRIAIYKLSDVGISRNLIGSLSLPNSNVNLPGCGYLRSDFSSV